MKNGVIVRSGNCEIGYGVKDDSHMGKFWYMDIREFLEDHDYIVIDRIFTAKESRNNGLATEFLKVLCEENNDKVIIVETGVLKDEYPEEPVGEEFTEILNKIDKFFTERGFSNFNKYSKSYEFKEAYIYTETEQGKEVFEAIKEYYTNANKEINNG